MNDIQSLSHSKWRCQYHIVFAPKYRRKAIYGKIKVDIGKILRKLCEQRKVEIIEAEAMSRPYTYVGEHLAKYERGAVYGLLKRQEQPNDL